MTDWKTYKGEGPWEFAKQADKWGYLNNPRWTRLQSAIDFSIAVGNSIDSTDEHIPCGHWHRREVATIPPTTDVPPSLEDVYVIHGRPTVTGVEPEKDKCYKISKELDTIIWYGGTGSGIDQLQCPFGVCVDDTYVWICDKNNSRLMKRLKSDLTYIDHRDSYSRQSCHTDGSQLWIGALVSLEELDITTMTTIRTNLTANPGVPGASIAYAIDITCDEDYLYVVDESRFRVVVFNKSDLTYVSEFGEPTWLTSSLVGCYLSGSYVFVSSWNENKIYKLSTVDWSVVAEAGSIGGGTSPYFINPYAVFGYGGLLYICLVSTDKVQIRNISDLSFVAEFDVVNFNPRGIYVDANYIYTTEWEMICRYDRLTYAFVDSTNLYDTLYGISSDGTHLYVVDEGSNQVIKLLLADLSFVSSYDDPGYVNLQDPVYCTVDANYVYVSDQGADVIHRINKLTMAYVDSFGAGNLSGPQDMSISSNLLYVSNFNSGIVTVFNLTTLLLVDSSPSDNPDADYVLANPSGITCDEDFIYVSNKENHSGPPGTCEIVLFDRNTLVFSSRHIIAVNDVSHIAVDDDYLYLAEFSLINGNSHIIKFDKVTFAQVDISTDHNQFIVSVDTWYPWWTFGGSGGVPGTVPSIIDDEPQVWPMD